MKILYQMFLNIISDNAWYVSPSFLYIWLICLLLCATLYCSSIWNGDTWRKKHTDTMTAYLWMTALLTALPGRVLRENEVTNTAEACTRPASKASTAPANMLYCKLDLSLSHWADLLQGSDAILIIDGAWWNAISANSNLLGVFDNINQNAINKYALVNIK